MEMKQNWPGWLLCFVCGLLDTTCFVALGGTFVGLMTGNLILMGVSFGELGNSSASLVFLLPLAAIWGEVRQMGSSETQDQ